MSDTKKCPFCAEEIKADAVRCKHCRSDLSSHQPSSAINKQTAEEKRSKQEADKRNKKILIWIAAVFFGILFWYIAIPVVIGYAVYKYTPLGKIMRDYAVKNKKQVIAGGVGVFLAFVAFGAYQSHRQKQIDNYPTPQIALADTVETNSFDKNYSLNIPVSNAVSVEYNGNTYAVENDTAIVPIDLTNQSVAASFMVKNRYKESSKSVTVKRNETEEERKVREEKEEAERVAAEEKRKQEQLAADTKAIESIKSQLKNLQEPLPEFDTALEMTVHIVLYKVLYDEAQKHKGSTNKELASVANQAINSIPTLQSRNFPKLRRRFAEVLNKTLWIDDGKAYVQGSTASTLNVVSHTFALNENVRDGYLAIADTLKTLRFDRVKFKWADTEYVEYQYYDIDSLPDNKVGS